MEVQNSRIVFFDGVCLLCNKFVDFLMVIDRERMLKFASLQGETATQLLGPEVSVDSVVYYANGQRYTESAAILKIASSLPGLWRVFSCLLLIPSPIRNFFYRIVANNRYDWFGKRESCRLPTKEESERILP